MNLKDFDIGDTVSLRFPDAPRMLVNAFQPVGNRPDDDNEFVECVWIDTEGDVQTNAFHFSLLDLEEKVSP